MRKRCINISWLLVLLACISPVHAQLVVNSTDTTHVTRQPRAPKIKKPKPYQTEISFGLRTQSNGWSFLGEYGQYKAVDERRPDDYFNTRIFTVEFTEKKHPRELKRRSDNQASQENQARKFIFAKSNYFYALKLGYGKRTMIAGKDEPGNVSIHWVYSGGLSLGLLKPYYINAFVFENGGWVEKDIKYSEANSNSFMNADAIVGRSAYFKGIGETKFVPGLHVRLGIHFDFATKKQNVFGIESGITAEVYTKKIELMVNQPAYPYTGNIYLGVQFGKRSRGK